jgi:hypothetical protein
LFPDVPSLGQVVEGGEEGYQERAVGEESILHRVPEERGERALRQRIGQTEAVLGLRDVEEQTRVRMVGELHEGSGWPESASSSLGRRVDPAERLLGGAVERALPPDKEHGHEDESRQYRDTEKTLHEAPSEYCS